MKLGTSLFLAAVIAAGGAVGNVWAQSFSETTITTAPAIPTVTTKTVTTKSVAGPPAVVVSPAPAVVINPAVTTSSRTVTTDEESDMEGGQVLGTSRMGNSTIVFKSADNRDIEEERLQVWDDFAEAHPAVASRLAYDPELINDPAFLARHPSLNAFFAAHPDIRTAMNEDPGNFAAIPPRPGE
ncbi:MAG TPA: hypothetical protein VKB84_09250 [Candidatus Binataceae bacterium]|nr:hypothetical protein [Candidatus Binataceae bacterium]